MSTVRPTPGSKSGRKNDKEARKDQQRALQREKEIARAQARRRRRVLNVGGGVLAVLAIAAAVVLALRGTATGTGNTAVAAGLGAPTSTVGSPPTGLFNRVGSSLTRNGKPELLFIGAQYCPHCAGQRWAIVKALDQFGSFSNVTSSSSADGTVPTFDLLHARYTSKYVAFDHKDLADRNHNPLQTLSPGEQSVFNRLDPSGGIPLITVGGYSLLGDGYDLSLIQGRSFPSVQHALQAGKAHDPLVAAVNGEANSITAFICHSDGMKPQSVCSRPAVRRIVSALH